MPSPETPPTPRETVDGIVATTQRIAATVTRLRARLDTLRQTIDQPGRDTSNARCEERKNL